MSLHFAYLDAGTGSIVFQAAIGTAAGGIFAFKNLIKKYSSKFAKFGKADLTADSKTSQE
jgi:hypothetical protein